MLVGGDRDCMSHLRKDPVSGVWVIVAEERAKRPIRYTLESSLTESPICPFCPGHEDHTPSAHYVAPSRQADLPWGIRVIPNRYPALRVEGQVGSWPDGVFDRMSGIGAHEVIVETPHHHDDIAVLSLDEVTDVLVAYRERLRDLKRDLRLQYILAFKNQGAMAGATLPHPHSQILATPTVPTTIEEELENCERYFEFKGRCLFCDIIHQERTDGTRVVYQTESVIAISPYASRFPFEVWLLPKHHASHYEDEPDTLLAELAVGYRDIMRRLQVELESPPYNLMLHTGPAQVGALQHYHWHIEIIPCLQPRMAGFELGTGCFINPTPPEVAASYLREADISTLTRVSKPK